MNRSSTIRITAINTGQNVARPVGSETWASRQSHATAEKNAEYAA